jgi:oligosaccharyltransferase complex subunit gamma
MLLISWIGFTLVSGYTLEYKNKKLNSIVKESNVLILDSSSYNVITEPNRNYSVLVLFTAMQPEFACVACQYVHELLFLIAFSR